MTTQHLKINDIPTVLWGDKSEKVFIAVHGYMSHKQDKDIAHLAESAHLSGYQLLSFDLPEHGERKDDNTPCKVQDCVKDLGAVMAYAKTQWKTISLYACSMGAYFSLLAYKDEKLEQSLFLSPVVNMKRIIENMMLWFNVSEERLKAEQEIKTPVGQTLYWDYYCYVKENPIVKWEVPTSILYGSKDNLCEFSVISDFTQAFHCDLTVMEDGEHYFHTDEQLNYFRKWLNSKIG